MMVMVMTMVNHNHHLRLRRIRDCEAEEEHEAEQSLFHGYEYGARHLRILSYCDHCLLLLNELANRASRPIHHAAWSPNGQILARRYPGPICVIHWISSSFPFRRSPIVVQASCSAHVLSTHVVDRSFWGLTRSRPGRQ